MNKKETEEIGRSLSRLAKASLIIFVGLILSKLFTYAYRIIIARHYGPEIYGLFSLAMMVLGFFISLAGLGFSEGILRFTPIYRAKREEKKINFLLKYSQKTILFSGIVSGLILFFFSEYIAISIFSEPELIIFLKIFSFLIPITLFANIYSSLMQGYEKVSGYSFGYNVLQNITKVLLLLFFILFLVGPKFAVSLSHFFGIFSLLLFAYLFCRIKLPKIFLKEKLKKQKRENILKQFFSYSWPLIFLGIIGSLLFWIDTFTLGFFKDAAAVGIYNAATPLALLLTFTGGLFLQLFFPLITRELSLRNILVARELSKQVNKWIFLLNLPVFAMLFLFPGAFLNIIWGEEYLAAEIPLRILSVGIFIFSLSSVPNALLSSKGKSKLLLFNTLFIGGVNLALNLLLVPKYELVGAAIATSFSFVLWAILLILEALFFVSIFPFRRKMARVMIALLLAIFPLVYFKRFFETTLFSISGLATFFFLFYLLLVFVTKAFDKNDWALMSKAFKKIRKK
jgi:O-antigen/teichoic acid export membrane protein